MFAYALRAAGEDVAPFLRRFAAAIEDGEGIEAAYTASIGETTVLKHVVGRPVAGLPFLEGLLEGARRSRLAPLLDLTPRHPVAAHGGAGRTRGLLVVGGVAVAVLVSRRLRR